MAWPLLLAGLAKLGAGTAAAGATGAGAAAGAGGLAATAAPAATSTGGLMGASAMGSAGNAGQIFGGAKAPFGPMNFSGVSSQMASPGTPGSVGGTPTLQPSGAAPGGGGAGLISSVSGMIGGPSSKIGRGLSAGMNGMQAPGLMRAPGSTFQPFQFDRNAYRFRRPLGF